MKNHIARLLIMSAVLLVVLFLGAALADTAYPGEWVCVAVDPGTGVKQTDFEGMNVSELVKLVISEDGTLTVLSFGETIKGTWAQASGGITAEIDGEQVSFALEGSQLVNNTDGVLMYLEKESKKPAAGGLLSLVKGSKYAGHWVAEAVVSQGVRMTEMEGIPVSQLLSFTFNRDGTLEFLSMGISTGGTWQETEGGITVTVDGTVTDMLYTDGKLVADSEGVTVTLIRQEGGAPTPAPKAPSIAGVWKAVRYDTMGYTFDAGLLFPDGCTLTLREDGTGDAFIIKDYTEKVFWEEKDGALSLSGSYVFSSPAYDAAKGELSVSYGSDTVTVFFKREDAQPAATLTPGGKPVEIPATVAPTVAPSPSPVPTQEAPAPVPTQEAPAPTPESTQSGKALVTTLFTIPFPGDGWVLNENWVTDRAGYCGAQYELKDADGFTAARLNVYASQEPVKNYRDKLKALTEYAGSYGRETPLTAVIGGISFYTEAYEKWGWQMIDYAARMEESGFTVTISVEQPQNIANLESILGSIAFTLPQLNPPNVDPPLPEDGEPYVPQTSSIDTASGRIQASWVKTGDSIVLDSIFNNVIAISGSRVYILTGKTLSAYTLSAGALLPDPSFAGGKMALPDNFEYLAPGKDGYLYVSQGFFNILAVKDREIVQDNSVSGDLAMHPGGEWGITFWANAEPAKVTAVGGVLTSEPWVLSNLSDAAGRQGRFSMISCVYVSNTRIYVAGTDVLNGDAQRVAVFDLEGKELYTFGGTEWTQDDAFGSVTGIVETSNGILVLDGNYRALKMFDKDGQFLWSVDSDPLLGTDYPWLSSMVPTGNAVLIAAAQERPDKSCDELLLFEVTGF